MTEERKQNYSLPRPLWERTSVERTTEKLSEVQLFSISNANSSFCFNIHRCDWDSKHIRKDVYRISSLTPSQPEMTSSISFLDWESSLKKPSIVWARLASEAGDAIRTLETHGLRYNSSLNSYIWTAKDISFSPCFNIRNASLEDAEQIGEIGANAFFFDRLFLDPSVENEVAENMYRDWSTNCVKGLCEKVLVVEINNEIAGFVSLTTDTQFCSILAGSYKRIVLVAVSSSHRGKGVGVQLVDAARQWTYNECYDFLLVGTSSVNLAAQNLYYKCGFKPFHSELSLGKSI